MELFNYKDNCRLCLKAHTDFMKNIFTHCLEGCQDTLVQNIFSLFRVELNSHEAYPQFICRKCLTELENILLFKEDLQRNQDFLLDLFSAAYPDYVEKKPNLKNLYTPNSSISSINFKSVAINTDSAEPFADFSNLGDSEYIRVPVNFMKQFSPQVSLQRINLDTIIKEHSEVKRESEDDCVIVDQESPVNICKYCSKEFRSQALVQTHYKKFHEFDGQQQKHVTRKRNYDNEIPKLLVKKIKPDENRNLPVEQNITSPAIGLQNNGNTEPKEELCVSPTIHQINKIEPTDSGFTENQALFLQNFDLIAKQEAELIKTKRESPKSLPKRHNFKKQIIFKKIKKTLVKPSKVNKIKNKTVVKPLTILTRKCKSRTKDPAILDRSVQFLKRYGWRKLNSSSRSGTILNIGVKLNSFQNENLATKSVPTKLSSPRNSTKSPVLTEKSKFKYKDKEPKTVVKDEGCENAQNFDNSDQSQVLMLSGIEKDTSVKSFDDKKIQKVAVSNFSKNGANSISTSINSRRIEEKQVSKESPTTSISSNKNNSKIISAKHEKNKLYTKLKSVVKSETQSASSKDAITTEEYKAISSKLFYNDIDSIHIKQSNNKKITLNKRTPNIFHNKRSLRGKSVPPTLQTANNRSVTNPTCNSRKSIERNTKGIETKLPDLLNVDRKYEKHNLHNYKENSKLSTYEPQRKLNETGLKLKLFRSGSTDSYAGSEDKSVSNVWSCHSSMKKSSLINLDDLEIKREQRSLLDKSELHDSSSELSVDIKFKENVSNLPISEFEGSNLGSSLKKDADYLPKKKGRPRKNCNNNLLPAMGTASTSNSKSNTSLLPIRNDYSLKKSNLKKELFVNRGNSIDKVVQNSELNTPIIVINDDVANEVVQAHVEVKPVSKRGRPRKHLILKDNSSSATSTILSGLNDQKSPQNLNYSTSNDKLLLDISPSNKNSYLNTLQDLNDKYEIDENIGLRIKLRKTVLSESLNSLKYDTQELDEKFPPEYEIDTKTNIPLTNVPDNDNMFMNHDKEVYNDSIGNIYVKDEESPPEKVVNLDLEDKEVQMLVLISDNEDADFDNDDISKFVKSRKSNLNLKSSCLHRRSKSCLPFLRSTSDSSDNDVMEENLSTGGSQTCLPLKEHILKEVKIDSIKKDHTDMLKNNRLRGRPSNLVNSKVTDHIPRRRGRPPIKFSPSTFTNRSKSTVELLRKGFDNNNSESTSAERSKPRSRSVSQTHKNISGNELPNEVKKRGRPPKIDGSKTISNITKRNSSPSSRPHRNLQQKNIFYANTRRKWCPIH